MSKTIAWSWTRLNDFETCPRMFQGKYITKDFPKPDFDQPHFIKGRAIHKAIEDYLKDGVVIPYPIVAGDEKFFVNLDFLAPLFDKMSRADSMTVEENICFAFDLTKRSWFAKDAWCRVIFDALVIVDDFALIIDWKSGKVKRHSDQLKLFAAAAMTLFPKVNRVMTAYIWCEHPKSKPTFSEYTRAEHDDLWMEFGDRAELIQMASESGNWPSKENNFCRFCDALPSQCEFKQGD